MGVLVRELAVNGHTFEIRIDTLGTFYALFEEERIEAETLKELTEKLTKISRVKRKPIPFCRMEGNGAKGYTLTDGTITKRNIGNGNLMVKLGDRRAEQEYMRSSTDRMYIRPLNDDEKIIYVNLYTTLEKAQAAIKVFEEARLLDVKAALTETT